MPILQSSIKSARQSTERRVRRQPYRTMLKTAVRRIEDLVEGKKVDAARAALPAAFKAIDTAVKKHIIHWKNAARKKSRLARMVERK